MVMKKEHTETMFIRYRRNDTSLKCLYQMFSQEHEILKSTSYNDRLSWESRDVGLLRFIKKRKPSQDSVHYPRSRMSVTSRSQTQLTLVFTQYET